ncbi:DUF4101 domain-containing protein [Cephalotus follicularis]|uniref:DUF4101 domain-containing protein n=1 Tax=Cephalotus follicularis TaxID=3775 RepID=A0A1Q3C0G4_CEPFO|nr:DUF4101 domain-containing protein [Cephalotus follicularis]
MALVNNVNVIPCLIKQINPPSFINPHQHQYLHFSINNNNNNNLGFALETTKTSGVSCRIFTKRSLCTLQATDTSIVGTATTAPASVEIPVSCYQLIGVPDQSEKDEIVKSVMDLKRAEIEDGYTMDAIVSRQNLLVDVRDKLLFEPEYAGDMRENIPPKSFLQIPWAWLPGALCLLQEVGEEKLVLDIGRAALQRPDAKPYVHDLLLSMSLAECAIAKIAFEKNKVSQGFEALARAQCLLRSKISLVKMTLLSQIEESLEELAPACTLEILGMPRSPENAERRQGAIAALCELLRQGLDAATSCHVQDWSCFLSQALTRLMATEIIHLLPWDNLAIIRKNKKSLESQNQRVVIDFNCFYVALIAHIAIGFSCKQTELIDKAKTICECLVASEGVDLKFEEAFCLFLLGQSNEVEAVGKLQQLESNSNFGARNAVSGKDIREMSPAKPSLEWWLKDAVLSVFPETRDCSPSLAAFFTSGNKSPLTQKIEASPQTMSAVSHRPLSTVVSAERRDLDDYLLYMSSSRHLGSAVKRLALTDMQSPLVSSKNSSGSNVGAQSVPLNRDPVIHHEKSWESWLARRNVVERITLVSVLGCIFLFTLRLSCMKLSMMRNAFILGSSKQNMDACSLSWNLDSLYNEDPACIKGSVIAGKFKKLLAIINMPLRDCLDAGNPQRFSLAASLSTSMTAAYRRPMPLEDAEALVKQWQMIKADALGPCHQVHSLSEALDESMLAQWQALADAAKARSCFWRFVLLQLSVLQAYIFSDGIGGEMAEIEARLEEAAELVDESQLKNPNYYSTYKVRYVLRRQDDGSWRFCEGDIQMPS